MFSQARSITVPPAQRPTTSSDIPQRVFSDRDSDRSQSGACSSGDVEIDWLSNNCDAYPIIDEAHKIPSAYSVSVLGEGLAGSLTFHGVGVR